jgi:predicted HicB family RNase H-like nuclease
MDDFDGFEASLSCIREDELGKFEGWQACLPELANVSHMLSLQHHCKEKILHSPEDAIHTLKIRWEEYKRRCIEQGNDIPIPVVRKEFSGATNIRIDKNIHKNLAIEAANKSISLNAIINEKLNYFAVERNYLGEIEIEHIKKSESNRTLTIHIYSKGELVCGLYLVESDLIQQLGGELVASTTKLMEYFSLPSRKEIIRKFVSHQILKSPYIAEKKTVIRCCIIINNDNFSIYKM